MGLSFGDGHVQTVFDPVLSKEEQGHVGVVGDVEDVRLDAIVLEEERRQHLGVTDGGIGHVVDRVAHFPT